MKKILIFNILFALLFSSTISFAQDFDDDDDEPMEFMTPKTSVIKRAIVNEKPAIEYTEPREDDVFWSTTIWRTIDCREKMNFHLYYPTQELEYRKSLAQALLEGINKKWVQAYTNEEFKTPLTTAEVMEKFGAGDEIITEAKMDGSGDTTYVRKNFINWGEVREFIVKEEWYFDKRHSKLNVRIVGIAPVKVFTRTLRTADGDEVGSGEEVRTQLFWVYFPEARRILSKTICYTGKNQNNNLTFDDIFHKRYFSSYITAEANALNDRKINDYTRNGLEAIMESERIKTEILKMESDMWEY